MANWKKIITSGSSAELFHITASGAINTLSHISASGNISASGAFTGSNLSGVNTGDQNLSSYAVIANVVANTSTGSFLVQGGTGSLTAITASGDISSSLTGTGSFGRVEATDFVGGTLGESSLTGSFSGSFSGSFDGIEQLIDISGTPAGNQLAIWSDSNTLLGDVDVTYDGTDLLVGATTGTTKLQFRDATEYIYSSLDGQLDLVAGNEVQITATNIDINGAVDISGNTVIGGNLTVNGSTTTISSTTISVADQFIACASGSSGSNVDGGLIVQSGSVEGSGSVMYHDISSQRWAVGKQVGTDASGNNAINDKQKNGFVVTIKSFDLAGAAPHTLTGVNYTLTGSEHSASYGVGEIIIDSSNDDIWILGS